MDRRVVVIEWRRYSKETRLRLLVQGHPGSKYRGDQDGAWIEVVKQRYGYYVELVWVEKQYRNTGIGTLLMRALCALADAEGADMELCAADIGGLSDEELLDWYGKFGFRVRHYQEMTRLRRTHVLYNGYTSIIDNRSLT